MIDEYYTFKIFGYHSDDLSYGARERVVAVCDDCGIYRSSSMNQYHHANDLCQSCARTGIKIANPAKHTLARRDAMSEARLAPKEPLPNGWQSKLCDITDNKECATYLGSIAEVILSNIYDNVQVMPVQNSGYDVICNRDFKIDIKASATGYKGFWKFAISKNVIADFFLCIAFESRDDLYNPVHLWMIPGSDVNHMVGIRISKSTIDKWSKYKLSLDKLLICCDNLSDNVKEMI